MRLLIKLHFSVLAERAYVEPLCLAEVMQAVAANGALAIGMNTALLNVTHKIGYHSSVFIAMVYVDAENIILTVKRIGERVSAVFSRILARLLKARPRFGIIALRKLARFRIDEILFDSSRIFSVTRSDCHPVGAVFHFIGNICSQPFLCLGIEFSLSLRRVKRVIGRLIILVRLSLHKISKFFRREGNFLIVRLILNGHFEVVGNADTDCSFLVVVP